MRRDLDSAEAVARRFLTALAAYEVGEAQVERELRASATPALARELLRFPVRIPPGSKPPPQARLKRLEVVPGEVLSDHPRLRSAIAYADLRREGREEHLEFALQRELDQWRVAQVSP